MSERLAVAVVGGGISGLAAAHRLVTDAAWTDGPVALFESGDRVGGAIVSVTRGDVIMEGGPDSILSAKPAGMALIDELGLSDRLVATDPRFRKAFIGRAGRLHPVPEGFYLLAPTAFWPFAMSTLVGPLTKLRMAMDLVIPRRARAGDESLASFVRRRLGREALDVVAQPMVGGIYSADPELLSLEATFPRFLELEERYGSVIRGLVTEGVAGPPPGGSTRARPGPSASGVGRAGTSGPRYGLFVSLQGGLETLTSTLASRLGPVVRRGQPIEDLRPEGDGWLLSGRGATFRARRVLLALPAHAAARLTRSFDPELGRRLGEIPYSGSATVNLVYRSCDVPHPLDGAGMVVPATEPTTMMACSFSSRKYPGRCPDDRVLLRAFVGGALHEDRMRLDDRALLAGVTDDLGRYLGLKMPPVDHWISRHPASMAQYHVGHRARVADLETQLGRWPTLALAGNGTHGVGIPDCIESAARAAGRLSATRK